MPLPPGFDARRLLGETIGGYQLQELLGTGNALVYRAFDPRKGEYVAFKLIAWPGKAVDDTTLRHIKPANLLFKGPNWYISDFGIARLDGAEGVTLGEGAMLGTLRYAAPEQLRGDKLTPATDVYSFGLVVYQMLAGGWPFEGRGPD